MFMKKIIVIFMACLCLVGCANKDSASSPSSTPTSSSDVPSYFFSNYEKANYDKFNSPASENGLRDTAVYVEGTLSSVSQTDDGAIFGELSDTDNNKWIIVFEYKSMLDSAHFTFDDALENYSQLNNHHILVSGIYMGYAENYQGPSVYACLYYDYDTDEHATTLLASMMESAPTYKDKYKDMFGCMIKKGDYLPECNLNSDTVSTTEPTAETSSSENSTTPTLEQQNAIKQAKSYLSFMAFSRQGLIEQLEYEGYTNESATYAVDNITVDWNEQAAQKAQDYIDYSSFSRQGLIDQLIYEGFTQEEAEYGVTAVGY